MSSQAIVFLDIAVEEKSLGRLVIALHQHHTSEIFRQWCTGEYRVHGKPCGYKHSLFHRIVPGFMIQSGELSLDERMNESLERGVTSHDRPGLLSLVSNRGQFMITCAACPFLDGKQIVLGHLTEESMSVLRRIENVPTDDDHVPKLQVKVTECGQL